MGIEFRLGRQDHNKVEDFLSRRPPGVDGIWIEAGNLRRQATAIEQARASGVDVLVEPMTERLADEGFAPDTIPYAEDAPLDLGRLRRSVAHRDRLIAEVLALQGDATILTPPHFYVTDADSSALNVALAAGALRAADRDMRAILLAKRDYLARPGVAADLAHRYADVGVTAIDLRLSPLGTDNEGARKIRSAYDIVVAFDREGIAVNLGYQGLLGQNALALGLVHGFSAGIGVRHSLTTARRWHRNDSLGTTRISSSVPNRPSGSQTRRRRCLDASLRSYTRTGESEPGSLVVSEDAPGPSPVLLMTHGLTTCTRGPRRSHRC